MNFAKLCKLIDSAGSNSILIGDFNFPCIDWIYETTSWKSVRFFYSTKEHLFDQLIDFPTHVLGNTLDLLLSNRKKFEY